MEQTEEERNAVKQKVEELKLNKFK